VVDYTTGNVNEDEETQQQQVGQFQQHMAEKQDSENLLPVEKGRPVTPYASTEEEIETAMAGSGRDPVGGFRQLTPDERLDQLNEQGTWMDAADHFVTFDGKTIAFYDGRDMSRANKYRQFIEQQGAYIPKYEMKDDGSYSRVMDVTGYSTDDATGEQTPIVRDGLYTSHVMRDYETLTGELGPLSLEDSVPEYERSTMQDVSSLAYDRTGYGDMKAADARLKALNVDNYIARVGLLSAKARGDNTFDIMTKTASYTPSTLVNLPKYVTQAAHFLAVDVVLELEKKVMTSFIGDPDKRTEELAAYTALQKNQNKWFKEVENTLDWAKALDMEDNVTRLADSTLRPEVVEEALRAETVTEAGVDYALGDASFYTVYGLYKTASAARQFPKLNKYLKEQYGGKDIAESLRFAYEKNPELNPGRVFQDYLKTYASGKARQKAEKKLNNLLQFMSIRPSKFRDLAVEQDIKAIEASIASSKNLRDAAVETVNPKIIARENKRITQLTQQKQKLMYNYFVPKGLRDAAAEIGLTTTFTTAATQVAAEFYGADDTGLMATEVAAVLMVAPVRLTSKYGAKAESALNSKIAGAEGQGKKAYLSRTARVGLNSFKAAYRWTLGLGVDAIKSLRTENNADTIRALDAEIAKSRRKIEDAGNDVDLVSREEDVIKALEQEKANLSPGFFGRLKERMGDRRIPAEVANFFKEIETMPVDFQNLFLSGLERQAQTRDDLIRLSASTGVDIDPDLMLTNLAKMSEITYLIDIADKLDQKIIATGLDDVAGAIVDRHQIAEQRARLVSEMAVASQQLTRALGQGGALAEDSNIKVVAEAFQSFIIKQNEQMKADRAYVDGLRAINLEVIEATAKTQIVDADNPQRALVYLKSEYDAALSRLEQGVSPALLLATNDPLKLLKESFAEVDLAHEDVFEVLKRITAGVSVDEGEKGAASTAWGMLFAHKTARVDAQIAKNYATWDLKNSDVHANVSYQFMRMVSNMDMSDPLVWDSFIDNVLPSASAIRGANIPGSAQAKFMSLFEEAAARGLATLNRELSQNGSNDLYKLLEEMEQAGKPAIEQWLALRKAGIDEGIEEFANLPMLISAPEWREVNRALGAGVRKSSNSDRREAYYQVYQDWGLVSDPDGTPFQRGWLDPGVPVEDVSAEAMAEFRAAQDYYKQERIFRYTKDPEMQKFEDTLNTNRIEAAGELDLPAFLKAQEDVNTKVRPETWLNDMMNKFKKQVKAFSSPGGGGLVGDQLHNSIGNALGMAFGNYDPKTGRYYILAKSADEADAKDIEVAQQAINMFQRHLQATLKATFSDTAMPRKAGGRVFNPEIDLVWDEDLFDSIFNLPMYEKKADGSIVPLVENVDGTDVPRYMFNEDEVYSVIGLDEIERFAADPKMVGKKQAEVRRVLKKAKEAQDNLFETIENVKVEDAYGNLVSLEDKIKSDTTFAGQVVEIFFGGVPPQGTAAGVARGANTTQADVQKAIYDAFVGGPMLDEGTSTLTDLSRLKEIMMDRGFSGEYVDRFIADSVNSHIVNVSQKWKGRNFNVRVERDMASLPEMEITADDIYGLIGPEGSKQRANLEQIIGVERTQTWQRIADVVTQVTATGERAGVDASIASMSLDSILSRIYNINRGVVSVQWVATESIIRAARQKSGVLLKAMLSDKEFAGMVLEVIETGKVPKHAVEINAWRALVTELAYQTGVNEAALISEGVNSYYDIFNVEPNRAQEILGLEKDASQRDIIRAAQFQAAEREREKERRRKEKEAIRNRPTIMERETYTYGYDPKQIYKSN